MTALDAAVPERTVSRPPTARVATRWVVVAVVVAHGLLHLLGAARGLGWADVAQLRQPIDTSLGWAWLATAALVVLAGILLALRSRWWWAVGAVAVAASQAMLLTSWTDAKAGTVANLVLFVAVVHGYASWGPASFRAKYNRRVRSALSDLTTTVPSEAGLVTEEDLAHLPELVAAYVRRSGAVGQPRVIGFHARIHGRIRGGPDKPWMRFVGEQVNTYGTDLTRLFFLDATMFGVPVDVLHTFVDSTATMQVKAASLVPMVTACGADMDRAETVTLFNDLCVLAPAALVDARVTWHPIDGQHVHGAFTNRTQTVSAELTFNDEHDLVGFVSEDRLRASPDGTAFTRQRWSTPITGWRTVGSRRLACRGEARWHAPAPEGEFSYLEFSLDDLTYNDLCAPTTSWPGVRHGRGPMT